MPISQRSVLPPQVEGAAPEDLELPAVPTVVPTVEAKRRLFVVGLGPGDPGDRTVAVQRALDGAARIVLRTAVHPGLDDLVGDPRVVTCDDLYDSLPTFDAVYDAVVERVLTAATAPGSTVFAVPGHPLFGERTVRLLLKRLDDTDSQTDLEVTVLQGVSAFDAVASALRVDLMAEQVQTIDALEVRDVLASEPFAAGQMTVDPYRPILVMQVYDEFVRGQVHQFLVDMLPNEQPVVVARAGSVHGEETTTRVSLRALSDVPVDHLTSVYVSPAAPLGAPRVFATLERIVARLRAPGGCPWDRVQSARSLRGALLDEAYEVVDAIDADDEENLAEELGDLLLLIVMQAQIAAERGDFSFADVVQSISTKLIRRHPHVFGDQAAATPDEVVQTWDRVKAEERRRGGAPPRSDDPIERLPRSMPALERTARIVRKQTRPTEPRGESPGDRLLDEVEAIVARGLDPESTLLAALRRRYGSAPTAAPSAPAEIRPAP